MARKFLRAIKAIIIFSVCISGIWSVCGWLFPFDKLLEYFDVGSWETVWIIADFFRPMIALAVGIPVALWIWNRTAPVANLKTEEGSHVPENHFLSHRKRLLIGIVIMVAYILTGALGVPAAQTKFTSHVIASHKELQGRHGSSSPFYPRIRLLVGFPLLPGVVVCYNDYQIAGMSGWGGWEFYAWYPRHIQLMWSSVRRLS